MDRVVVEKEVMVPVQQGEGTASNAIWAVAMIVIVAIIAGSLYYSGVLRRLTTSAPSKVNIEVSAPAAAPAPAAPANR